MIEVKIKQGNEMLDATIEMVDGVMVVSPKVEKFELKDGDILSSYLMGVYKGTFVFEKASECRGAIFHIALDANGKFIKGNGHYFLGYVDDARPATEEEKKKLFDKLAEECFEWDAENRELVKIKWKPRLGEVYYYPCHEDFSFHSDWYKWGNDDTDDVLYNKGVVFKTEEECQAFVNKLNQVIEGVKP